MISTNFSGRHFESDGEEFLNRIQHVLSKYSVRPEYIEIEVTEGVLVKNVAVLEKCMNRLHEIGFRVAIDDFGTGYSSLSVLADMPADVIKIDKSFINKGMTEQKKNLLYEIGRMVKILHKDIIIEGWKRRNRSSSSKKVDSPADRDIYAIVRFRLATLKRCICKKTRNAVAIA